MATLGGINSSPHAPPFNKQTAGCDAQLAFWRIFNGENIRGHLGRVPEGFCLEKISGTDTSDSSIVTVYAHD